jgi:ubiquinone/menaquinone biosynthesis C-methylase UbiE
MNELYDREREYFLSFLARTDQKKVSLSHIKEFLPLYSRQTADAMLKGEQVNLLDIGAGTGIIPIQLVDSFKANAIITAHEPSLGMAVNLVLNYLVYDMPMQNLRLQHSEQANYDHEKYDTIIASQSFHYLNDWKMSAENMYDALLPGGAACVIMSSKYSNLFELRKRLFPKIHGLSPGSGEDLVKILADINIPHQAHYLESMINVDPNETKSYKALREFGILKPSQDALYSFLLRTNFKDLPTSLQQEACQLISERSKNDLLPIKDLAIWITKPGIHKAKRETASKTNVIVTLGDFIELFRPQFDHYFGKQVSFLSTSLKEAYYTILAFDCVISHPISKLTIMEDYNSDTLTDPEGSPLPIKGRRMKDFVLVGPHPVITGRLCDWPAYLGTNYLMWHMHNSDAFWYMISHIEQEYDFLPKEETKGMSPMDFTIFLVNLIDKYKPNEVFSSRYDGSTQTACVLNPHSYLRKGLLTPRTITPELVQLYKNISITLPPAYPIQLYRNDSLTLPEPSPRATQNNS